MNGRGMAASTPSLRAQRSNPDCQRGETLDCFATLAMTEQGANAPYTGSNARIGGIAAVSRELSRHFPPQGPHANELPDAPVVM